MRFIEIRVVEIVSRSFVDSITRTYTPQAHSTTALNSPPPPYPTPVDNEERSKRVSMHHSAPAAAATLRRSWLPWLWRAAVGRVVVVGRGMWPGMMPAGSAAGGSSRGHSRPSNPAKACRHRRRRSWRGSAAATHHRVVRAHHRIVRGTPPTTHIRAGQRWRSPR